MNSNRPFILSATDFSPAASEAATVAAKLSLRRSESLRLVHVSDATTETGLENVRSRLDAEAQRLRAIGAEVETQLLEGGRSADALLERIRKELPRLVVVSSSAKGPIDRWALGSFSERIAETSPVPTLIVRHPAAFESWDWIKDRLTVLLALDLYTSSDVVLRWAKDFQMAGPCDLVACYVNPGPPTNDETSIAVNPPALQSRLERELHKKVRDQMGDDVSNVVVRPFFGDPGICIVEIARRVKAQLIVVGAHQRHGFSRLAQYSVSREVLHHSENNVVCVPITAKFDPREAHIPDFRRVLVATDFSEPGNAAVPFACAACAIGGLVKVVHVAPPRADSPGAAGSDRSVDLRQQLLSLVPQEAAARCQPPQVDVLENRDVAAAICGEADRFGADLVCLASHGLGASRALHGSVTKQVLNKIRRPFLVIRRPEDPGK